MKGGVSHGYKYNYECSNLVHCGDFDTADPLVRFEVIPIAIY